MSDDGRTPITAYMRSFVRDIDGLAWVVTTVAALVIMLDMVLGIRFVPTRETSDFGKAVVLLVFTPLLTFLMVTMLRQLPFLLPYMRNG